MITCLISTLYNPSDETLAYNTVICRDHMEIYVCINVCVCTKYVYSINTSITIYASVDMFLSIYDAIIH
jgi:hypothetical protein